MNSSHFSAFRNFHFAPVTTAITLSNNKLVVYINRDIIESDEFSFSLFLSYFAFFSISLFHEKVYA